MLIILNDCLQSVFLNLTIIYQIAHILNLEFESAELQSRFLSLHDVCMMDRSADQLVQSTGWPEWLINAAAGGTKLNVVNTH